MGYKGSVSDIGPIKALVKQATGQDKLIPRMFIFGKKVGAFTLNAIGDFRYNTIDVWEARFIRSYFKGMFDNNQGLPANVGEHKFFQRYTGIFKQEFEKAMQRKADTSALQALRWYYIIDTAKQLGYSGASTNETISTYTKRYLARLGTNPKSGRKNNQAPREGVRGQAQEAKASSREAIPPTKVDRFLPERAKVAPRGNRFMAAGR